MKKLIVPILFALVSFAGCGAPLTPEEQAQEQEEVAVAAQSLMKGGITYSMCRLGPLQCGGSIDVRAVYPGCTAECPPGQTAFCMPGSCFLKRAPRCYCNTTYYP